jgi:hypothetical protein
VEDRRGFSRSALQPVAETFDGLTRLPVSLANFLLYVAGSLVPDLSSFIRAPPDCVARP